jgi:hypothetical protein
MIPNVVQFPRGRNAAPANVKTKPAPHQTVVRILVAACFIALGFGIGVIATLKVVGF